MTAQSVKEVKDLKGKTALVRVDWSVPVTDGKVSNDYQIKISFPTIKHLQDAGAKVVLISHAEHDKDSLAPIFKHVKEFLPLTFETPSDLVLMENLRRDKREHENSEEFAKELASLGDIYVNEAFSVSHREHASIVGVPKLLPSYIGFQFEREIKELSKTFFPKHPFLFILGGAKFETKLPLLEKFMEIADHIFVGGALANDFLKARGDDVGNSVVSEKEFDLSKMLKNEKLILPEDTIIGEKRILDIGPRSIEHLQSVINSSKLIMWNGPLGHYELGYKVSTLELAKMIAASGKESVVGGGDTLAAITELNLLDKFSFVSTGGGAMLDFLVDGSLPGLDALTTHSPHP